MTMQTKGTHILCEYHGCDGALLGDQEHIGALMRRAVAAAGAKVVGCLLHPFSPQGVSGVVLVEESHLSIHTWPEVGYAAVDFYTCGDCDPQRADPVIREGLGATRAEVMVVGRGEAGGLEVRSRSRPAGGRGC